MTEQMNELKERHCRVLARFMLEDEPCADDPLLYGRHVETLTQAIKDAIDLWFSTPDDNPLWCDTCEGRGYVVMDAEWEPYAVQCPSQDCKDRRPATKGDA